MGGRTFGHPTQFAITLAEISDNGSTRRIDVWAADRWLTCDDNNVYVPHFAGCLKHELSGLLSDPQCRRGRPYSEHSIADNFRRLRAEAESDNTDYHSYRFMDWGPTSDNVGMLLFREGGTAYLAFSFWRPDHHAPAELGEVFVAELPEWELAVILHDAAWAIMWDWVVGPHGSKLACEPVRTYHYVGPKDIAERCQSLPPGTGVATAGDIAAWAWEAVGMPERRIAATFVVDTAGRLRLADRHSEHVACAGGGPVLAAGEITLVIRSGHVTVEGVSNQSIGYCPEPESWWAVAAALAGAGVEAPQGYTLEVLFRRCPRCGQINIVKDRIFECAVCESELPADWNLDAPSVA